jgi:hypothetical protein
MTMSALATTTLPRDTGSGYVAAAYIVFVVVLLIYVAIMALRLTRVERRLSELQQAPVESDAPSGQPHSASGSAAHEDAPRQALEREPA